ncbi:MAG: alternative ribosome rescue aminoacyl-tRNA hydrolase ArfB [Gillisia sp.]
MPHYELLKQELVYKAVKSSGPGGQHVNKTASKVIVQYDIPQSAAILQEEKTLLLEKLSSRLTNEGILIMDSSESRSQHKNKELVTERILNVVAGALKKQKPRKKTRPTKASKLKRLHEKKAKSAIKADRRKPEL